MHCHSTASDGTRPPAEVVARAADAGLDVVALTDHDTVAGRAGRCRRAAAWAAPHLWYGAVLPPRWRPQHAPAVLPVRSRSSRNWPCDALDQAQQDRPSRADGRQARRAGHRRHLGAGERDRRQRRGRPSAHRPRDDGHGVVETVQDAFTGDWIGSGGRAHVARYALDPAERDRPRACGRRRDGAGTPACGYPRLDSTRGLHRRTGRASGLTAWRSHIPITMRMNGPRSVRSRQARIWR